MVDLQPFFEIQERLFKRAGKIKKEITPLFPGYVFVESELSGRDFLIRTRDLMRVSCAVVGLLRYSDTEVAMRESERQILLCLCDGGNCIKSSSGIIEKDRILITEGPLKGLESIVHKVDRHKRRAYIEIEFMGENRMISVPLQIMQKLK